MLERNSNKASMALASLPSQNLSNLTLAKNHFGPTSTIILPATSTEIDTASPVNYSEKEGRKVYKKYEMSIT